MKRYLFITILTLFSLTSRGQTWHQMLSQGETDFKKIQNAFYTEWKDKPVERGNGYKLFKRWEDFMSTRLDRKGRITNTARNYFIRKSLTDSKGSDQIAERSGNTWRSLGLKDWVNAPGGYNPGNGRINCISFVKGDENEQDKLFIGAPVGGIWQKNYETDGWDILSEELTNVGVTDIYIDPDNPQTIYILSGDAYASVTSSIGVLKSTNGGESWEPTGLSHEEYSSRYYFKLEVPPSKKNVMLVAGNSGIERSSDYGETWENVLNTDDFSDLIFHPVYDSIVYASANFSSSTEIRFYKSSDWGATWHDYSIPNVSSVAISRTALAVSEDEPDFVYLLAADAFGGFGGIYRSEDVGVTFQRIAGSPNILNSNLSGVGGQGNYDLALAVNPANAMEVYVGGFYIYKSEDGGRNFSRINRWQYNDPGLPYVHADIHTLDFYDNILYTGCDGGIFRSEDLGSSWRDLSAGLDISQFYRIGLDPNDESVIIGGTQDNGANIRYNDQWWHIYGADGMEALVDHTDGDIVYQSVQFGRINKFSSKGLEFEGAIAGPWNVGSGAWVTPYQMDPEDHEVLYAGYENVMKTTNGGGVWVPISDFRSSSLIRDLQVAETDPDYIYVTNGDNLMLTKDGGNNWVSIHSGLPLETISRIAVSKNNPEVVWVTLGGFSEGEKVYQSFNAGRQWKNISEGLPNIPTNCIVHQKNTENQLYVGTDIGVFERKYGDSEWKFYSDGLPGVIINELEIHEAGGKLRAATFGRGTWEIPVIDSSVQPLEVNDIIADMNIIAEGDFINFSADVDGEVLEYFWEFEGGAPATSINESQTVFYTNPGEFDVKLTVKGFLENRTVIEEKLISVNKVLSTLDEKTFFNVYPIPASDILFVEFGSVSKTFQYQLINPDGKIVIEKTHQNPVSSTRIDLKNLDDGIYFLKVVSENQQHTRKIVVAR